LRNIVALGVSLPDAVRMLTKSGYLAWIDIKRFTRVGADADILLLDNGCILRESGPRVALN